MYCLLSSRACYNCRSGFQCVISCWHWAVAGCCSLLESLQSSISAVGCVRLLRLHALLWTSRVQSQFTRWQESVPKFRTGRFSDLDLWPSGLWMGSRVTRFMGFPSPSFQLPTPFRSRLRVRHGTDRQTDGQTDRQTDGQTANGHHCISLRTVGAGA